MEERYRETHNTWDSIAKLYELRFMELPIYDETYKAFCEFLDDPQASVLELGCGPGNITRRLLEICPDLDVLATDVSQQMIDRAKKHNAGITTRLLDCRELDTLDGNFGGIVCGFTIPYLAAEDVAILIAQCSRLLDPEGVLYLSYVDGAYDRSGFISGSSGQRTYFYYHEHASITKHLEANNLTMARRYEIPYQKADGTQEVHIAIIARNL